MCLGVVLSAALVADAPAWAWSWPADGAVLRGFSVGADTYAAGQHRGVDIALDAAPAVRAPVAGKVTFAGQVPTNGLTVTIALGDTKVSLTHLGALRVRSGATVSEGDVLADAGPTGDAEHAVPYVHLGVRVGSSETYVDPLTLLPSRGAPFPPSAPETPPALPSDPEPAPPTSASPPNPVPTPAPPESPSAPVSESPAAVAASFDAPGSGGGIEIGSATVASPTRKQAMSERPSVAAAARSAGPNDSRETASTPRVRPVDGRTVSSVARVASAAGPPRPRTALSSVGEAATRPTDAVRGDWSVSMPAAARPTSDLRWIAVGALLVALGGAGLGAARIVRNGLLMIGARERAGEAEEDSGRSGVAVREWPAAHRPCRGLRRPVRHLRPLSPASRKRRPHGQRDGRARHAGHGRGRRGRRVAA